MNNTFVNIISDGLNLLADLYRNKSTRPYFLISLLSHIILIIILLFNYTSTSKINLSKLDITKSNNNINKQENNIIKAIAVDEQQVEQEINRLNKIEEKRKEYEIIVKNKLKQEQEKLAKIKKQKEIEVKKLNENKKKLAKLEQEKKQEAERLAKIKQQKLAQEQAAKEAKRQQEEQKLAELKKQELLKKKQEELLKKLKADQENNLLSSLNSEARELEAQRLQQQQSEKEISRILSQHRAKISRNWLRNDIYLSKKLEAKMSIKLDNSGKVLTVNIIKSSGNNAFDISAKNAVLKSSPLAMPEDQKLSKYFNNYVINFSPDSFG